MTLNTLIFFFAVSAVFIAAASYGIFWSIKNNQFDDLEGPAQRILTEDDVELQPHKTINYEWINRLC